ncbi:hypothetical protein ACNF42_07420 [Cuniculiplasma sp. SKW3]|uniref:hypothetical protein n=1 Tax=unclassified Cuniculiplasma TaxID=2619706 RepID=UPI003FCF0689
MNNRIYPALLILSAISLSIGGYSLYAGRLVPFFLTILTVVAIGVLVILSIIMIIYENKKLRIVGVILAIVSIITSLNSSHISALLEFGSNFYLSIADVTMITGFFLFPTIYIIVFLMNYVKDGGHD